VCLVNLKCRRLNCIRPPNATLNHTLKDLLGGTLSHSQQMEIQGKNRLRFLYNIFFTWCGWLAS